VGLGVGWWFGDLGESRSAKVLGLINKGGGGSRPLTIWNSQHYDCAQEISYILVTGGFEWATVN